MPSDFSVVAIISAYNEADILDQVVSDLIGQGVQVYLLDDGSTDGAAGAVERHLGRGLLGIERLSQPAADGGLAPFNWERILLRKTELAVQLDASWFIHHDADEFRESPWPHLSLRDAIQHVDALGFNAIDFRGLDFWPVHDNFHAGDDVRETFTHYSELAPYDLVQVRCWKKTIGLELVSSGGHEARFPGRKVFPLQFILRHYPIRGQAHGVRKVFQERRNRFRDQERARGWHVQYDQMRADMSFVRDASTLTPYDPEALRLSLTLRPRYPDDIEEALRAARCEVAATGSELAAAGSEMAAMRREIEAASTHIEHVTASLGQAREDLRAREKEAAELHRHLEQRTSELADARATAHAELQARRAYIDTLAAALDQRASEVEQWRSAVDGLTRRMRELEGSLSWRWTAPARAIFRRVKGS